MTTLTSRLQAVAAAGVALAAARAERDSLPPRLAAEAAHTAGGPPVDQIERRIRVIRGLPVLDAA